MFSSSVNRKQLYLNLKLTLKILKVTITWSNLQYGVSYHDLFCIYVAVVQKLHCLAFCHERQDRFAYHK